MPVPPVSDAPRPHPDPESDPESDRGPVTEIAPTVPDVFQAPHQTCEELYRKYVSLFDFAPIGYLVIDGEDFIRELNLSAAVCLNAPRTQLTGRNLTDLIHREDLVSYYRQKETCKDNLETAKFELKMKRMDGFFFDAQLQMQSVSSRSTDAPRYSVALVDISEHVQLSSSFALQQDCLEIACQAKSMPALLDGFVQAVKGYLKCAAVGIRIRDDRGNIPFHSHDGFSQGFYQSENALNLHTDQCLCIDVIKAESRVDQGCRTAKGSFYINGTTRFLQGLPADLRGTLRQACNQHGYESVAWCPFAWMPPSKG
ncbi:PAS domain-containing protein [Desulfosarcina cetonica]|uniref:PAS domain-containing protein n=1 Tax=Desulfosarcina cetonica TaxID=90730 RepID=UPI0006D1514A|nr:PAS domain-containing protein [Desulfosarcina cetonica]